MKRTLTILTAAMFLGAIAIPAFAQMSPEASPAAASSPTMGKKHHHHKKKKDESGSMASPEAAPSDSTSK